MVQQVDTDSRGVIAPDVGLRKFTLTRHEPSAVVARFVDRYWVVQWQLDRPFTQQVLAHPVVNVVVENGTVLVSGVQREVGSRVLTGSGRALGMMFRPGGFGPFSNQPVARLTGRRVEGEAVVGELASRLVAATHDETDPARLAAAADAVLAPLVPGDEQPCESVIRIAESIATNSTHFSVESVAEAAGVGVRTLQRLFAEHVGVNPKFVIRRYRLYEAAERVAHGEAVNWAAVAAELGFSDQAHLSREFSAAIGMSPARYAAACAATG